MELKTEDVVETIRQRYAGASEKPQPEWVRGTCPQCGSELVSNCYYVGGRGYLVTYECWESLKNEPTCTYRRVL